MFSSKAIRVEIFSSFSPCNKCCELVTHFAETHPGCSVSIAFTCVYRHGEEAHCAALRKLHLNGVLSRLDVFRAAEWRLLESCGILSLSPYAWWNMREWDFFWRDKLMAILNPVRQVRLKSLFWLPSSGLCVFQETDSRSTSKIPRLIQNSRVRYYLHVRPLLDHIVS